MLLVNTDPKEDYEVQRGDRIAQLVIQAVATAEFDRSAEADLPAGRAGHRRLRAQRALTVEPLAGLDARLPGARDRHQPPARGGRAGARPARGPPVALLADHPLRPDPPGDRAADPSGAPAAPAGAAGCPSASTTRCGSTTPSSSSTTTCDGPASPSPGGRELDGLVADVMSRPLDPDRPLWEMVVVEGLGRRTHGLAGQAAPRHLGRGLGGVAAGRLLRLGPRAARCPSRPSRGTRTPLPSSASLLRYAAASLARQPEVAAGAFQRGVDALVDVAGHNRRLADKGAVTAAGTLQRPPHLAQRDPLRPPSLTSPRRCH